MEGLTCLLLTPLHEAALDERVVEISPGSRRHVVCTPCDLLSSYDWKKYDVKPQALNLYI